MSWHFLSCWSPCYSVWCKGWQNWCHIGEHTAFPPKSECIFEWSPQTRFSHLRAPTTSLGQPCSSLLTWIWPHTIHTQFRPSRVKRLLVRVLMLSRPHPLRRGTAMAVSRLQTLQPSLQNQTGLGNSSCRTCWRVWGDQLVLVCILEDQRFLRHLSLLMFTIMENSLI